MPAESRAGRERCYCFAMRERYYAMPGAAYMPHAIFGPRLHYLPFQRRRETTSRLAAAERWRNTTPLF